MTTEYAEMVVDQRFCLACGTVASGFSTNCGSCGAQFVRLTIQSTAVGNVLSFRSRLRRRLGVVVEERADESTLMLSNGKMASYPASKLQGAEVLVDMTPEPSPAFRFEQLMSRDGEWRAVLSPWLAENIGSLLADTNAARLYAQSAATAGRPELAEKSGLGVKELNWLRMHAAAAAGDWHMALKSALQIEPDKYPDHVRIMVKALVVLGRDAIDSQGAESIARIPDEFQGAALAKLLVGRLPLVRVAEIVDAARAFFSTPVDASIVEWLGWLAGDDGSPPPTSPSVPIPYERAVAALATAEPTDLSWADLLEVAGSFPSIADDLVDAENVTVAGGDELISYDSGNEGEVYLLARTRPADVRTDELEHLGHEWEIARRAFLAGDQERLLSMDGSAAAQHYLMIRNLRDGHPPSDRNASLASGTLDAVAASLRDSELSEAALSDPTVWPVLHDLIDAGAAAKYPEQAPRWHLKNAIDHIFGWRWDEAADSARSALRDGKDEVTRDEALSLLAYTHYQRGDDSAAIQALAKALEDDYTASLQANMGVVAEHLDPESAAEYLGQLASEAPDAKLRLAAARRAYSIWNTSPAVWEEGDEVVALPAKLRDVFRRLAVEETPLEDHRQTMRLLALLDSEWLGTASSTDRSPHASTWDHRVYAARARRDPAEYLSMLASALRAEPGAEWLQTERDEFVQSTRVLMFDSLENIGPAMYAWEAIKAGVPMEPIDTVVLTCGALVSILRRIEEEEGAPADQLLKYLRTAEGLWSTKLGPEEQERTKALMDLTFDQYARTVGNACVDGFNQAVEAANKIGLQVASRMSWQVKWSVVREMTRPLRRHIRELAKEIENARDLARGTEAKDWLGGLAKSAHELDESVRVMSKDKR